MDFLPLELQFHILSFLTIVERFKLRRVSRSFKQMSESHLKTVKRLISEKRELYSPLHANCCVTDTEICAAIIHPLPLICVLTYCTGVQCLFIGRIPTHYSRFWGRGTLNDPQVQALDPKERSRLGRQFSLQAFRRSGRKCDREDELNEWTEEQFNRVVNAMMRMDDLMCLSWIRLSFRLPHQLRQRLEHIFCPSIMIHLIQRALFNCIVVIFIEREDRRENLQETDYSEVVLFAGIRFFVERHGMKEGLPLEGTEENVVWKTSLRCPVGDDPFVTKFVPYISSYSDEEHFYKDYHVLPFGSGEAVVVDTPHRFFNFQTCGLEIRLPSNSSL